MFKKGQHFIVITQYFIGYIEIVKVVRSAMDLYVIYKCGYDFHRAEIIIDEHAHEFIRAYITDNNESCTIVATDYLGKDK